MLRSVFGKFRPVSKQTVVYYSKRAETRFPKFKRLVRYVAVGAVTSVIVMGIKPPLTVINMIHCKAQTLPIFQFQYAWRMVKGIADTVEPILPAVVYIERPDGGSGSGFFVDKEGLILTNNHVIEGHKMVMICTADEEAYHGVVQSCNAELDLAVIKIQGATKEFPFIKFGDSDNIRKNDFVMAIGHPLGWRNCVSTGVVIDQEEERKIIDFLFSFYFPFYLEEEEEEDEEKISSFLLFYYLAPSPPEPTSIKAMALIYPGNSGGPLINQNGEAVGVVYAGTRFVSYDKWKKNPKSVCCYAIPSNAAEKFLSDSKKQEEKQTRQQQACQQIVLAVPNLDLREILDKVVADIIGA